MEILKNRGLNSHERAEQANDLLGTDEIRRHRTAEGLVLTPDQVTQLHDIAGSVATFSDRMSRVSNHALDLVRNDGLPRTIRRVLGTDPIHQARKRGEIGIDDLPHPVMTKVDIVITADGFKIVEIEPGKLRGLGYGRMVREQSEHAIGISSEVALESLTEGDEAAFALSATDRFHIPEMSILERFNPNITVASQEQLDALARDRQLGGRTIASMMMLSPLRGKEGKSLEQQLREQVTVISDRRPDLEAKGALALIHNAGEDAELEGLLVEEFGAVDLATLRKHVPGTFHPQLVGREGMQELREAVESETMPVFLKPISDSGTRGIVTPDQPREIAQILSTMRANKYVAQEAVETVKIPFDSVDVLDGTERSDEMNVRITLHVDHHGNIVEASAVGSPHDHLAHGGKTSVITSVEAMSV